MKIVLLQDLDSRTLLAGKIIDEELTEEIKTQLVDDGKAAIWPEKPEKKVRHDKIKFKAS